MEMRGIILAGGAGTRLLPMTKIISKQILPVYDKPMIYYPLAVLMRAEIRDILIISTPRDLPYIEDLLGDGSQFGLQLSYAKQDKPEGIAQAFLIGENFIANQPVCLILGDNIFYGRDLSGSVSKSAERVKKQDGACVFAYHVSDPERYGVLNFEEKTHKIIGIEEKPKNPKSNWAVTGLYCYDGSVSARAKALKPSARGELEITDLNNSYLADNALHATFLGRGTAWLDAGTPASLLQAANFIETIETRQGLKIGCIEEIAFHNRFIDEKKFQQLIDGLGSSDYAAYLRRMLSDGSSFWELGAKNEI
jgi:glucose-1-phosphate thymidylyltransferase